LWYGGDSMMARSNAIDTFTSDTGPLVTPVAANLRLPHDPQCKPVCSRNDIDGAGRSSQTRA
jgi:hypothetical protein